MQPTGRACWRFSAEYQYTCLERLMRMLIFPPAGGCMVLAACYFNLFLSRSGFLLVCHMAKTVTSCFCSSIP